MVGVYKSIYGVKLERFRKKLGCSRFEAIGILVSLWLFAEERESKLGEPEAIPWEDLEGLFAIHTCGSEYSPAEIVSALEQTHWIDRDGNNVHIHDWRDWQFSLREYNNHRTEIGVRGDMQKKQFEPEEEEYEQLSIDGREIPIESSPSKNKKNKNEYTEDFEEFWSLYPRRVEKSRAFKVYQARIKEGHTPGELKEATERYAVECRSRGTEEWYIKHPATFLGPSKPFMEYVGDSNGSAEKAGRKITDEYDYSVPYLT